MKMIKFFRVADRRFRLARIWSNQELRKIASAFGGTVVNVSAGDDIDKEGGKYKNYFLSAKSYHTTNYSGATFRGYRGRPDELSLDLEDLLPEDLAGRYDVVFNHTTLEHVRHIEVAFSNLCRLSSDIVILVVPFAQIEHETSGYKDYWRFTPRIIRDLFQERGLSVIYESANNHFNASVYLFFVATKNPEKWAHMISKYDKIKNGGQWIGDPWWKALIRKLIVR